jgi:CO/xanthine dehydrogenase Mo-binding subunit
MIVEGQVHGGLAQGIGQALLENCVYDNDSGQLLTGSFMDYTMPRADDLPNFKSDYAKGTPCTHNPLGVKGCGEAGAIARAAGRHGSEAADRQLDEPDRCGDPVRRATEPAGA